jgi:hypothetical protein
MTEKKENPVPQIDIQLVNEIVGKVIGLYLQSEVGNKVTQFSVMGLQNFMHTSIAQKGANLVAPKEG